MQKYNEYTVTIKMVLKEDSKTDWICDSIWDCLDNGEDIISFNSEISVSDCGPVDNEV